MDVGKAYNMVVDKLNEWLNTLIVMLPNLAVAILVIVGFYLLAKLLKKFSAKLLNRFSNHMAINHLLANIISFVIISIGFFIALGLLQLDKAVTSLLAGAGIIGLALGFAFQDLAANFMSGIVIAIKQPFKIDDLIKSNDYFGVVKRINLRTTDILTPQGQMVLIPNKDVFQNPLTNYSETGQRRIDLAVGVSYGDDLEKVKRITIDAVKDIPHQIMEKEVDLFYEEFGDSSINFALRVWLNTNSQKEYKHAVSELVMKVKKAYDENDITIPFPIRTLDFGIKGGEKLSEMFDSKITLNADNKS